MSHRGKYLFIAAALVCVASMGQTARADFVVDFKQVGGNVVATGSGSIDLAALADESLSSVNSGRIIPAFPFDVVGPSVLGRVSDYGGFTGPSSFGPGGSLIDASFGSGDFVGVEGASYLLVPYLYVSGAPLSDSSTWSGQSFSSLGITPGTYEWTWGSGATADSYTLIASVPEPSTWLLATLGVGGLWFARRPGRIRGQVTARRRFKIA